MRAAPRRSAREPAAGILRGGQHIGRPPHEGVCAVGELERDDHLPRVGPLRARRPGARRGRRRRGCGGRAEGQGQRGLGDAERGPHDPYRPGLQAGHDQVVHRVGGDPGLLECVGEGGLGQRHVSLLAKPLLPQVRVDLAGYTPAVEEFLGGGCPTDQLEHGAVGNAREGHRTVAALALVPTARGTGAQLGGARPGPGVARRYIEARHQRADRGAHRAHQVVAVARWEGRGPRGWSWRWSCPGRRGRSSRRGARRAPPELRPGHGGRPPLPWSSCPRRRRRRSSCPARPAIPAPARSSCDPAAKRAGKPPKIRCPTSSAPQSRQPRTAVFCGHDTENPKNQNLERSPVAGLWPSGNDRIMLSCTNDATMRPSSSKTSARP